jgi:hypothetical protein
MSDLGHHIMLRCDDDRVLAPSVAARRALACAVYRTAAPFPLLCFGAADNHLHLVVLCDRQQAVELVGRLKRSLRWALGLEAPWFPARIKRLADQHHAVSTFHYVLGQRNRHGVGTDPALDASSLPELLGLRIIPTDTLGLVRERIPRLGRERLLLHLGQPDLQPASAATIAALVQEGQGELLRDAAAGALGLPDLTRRSAPATVARHALLQVLAPHCGTLRLARLTERSPSLVRSARQLPRRPQLERAVRLRIDLAVRMLDERGELPAPAPGDQPLRGSA